MNIFIYAIAIVCVTASVGCGAATSREEQQRALGHQESSDKAADAGAYEVAGDEQRAAHDTHHDAVTKAIDEGGPIPPQTKPGDVPAPPPPK